MFRVVMIMFIIAPLACQRSSEMEHAVANDNANRNSKIPTHWFGAHVVILGTGTPNADPERSGPAVAVIVNGTPYIVDAGPGIVRRAAAAYNMGIEPLAVDNLKRVFITHLHSDHTLGLPDLMYTPWVLERHQPLEAYGPAGLQNMTDHIQKAYDEDIHMRLDGLEPANETGYKINVHEINSGVIYTDDNVKVTAFAVNHGSWKHAFGYRFDTGRRSIVISGDSAPSRELIDIARHCDILVHEVYSTEQFQQRPPEWQAYHKSFHTSTTELADIAKEIQPRQLILYHQLYWGATDQDLIDEVARLYKGTVKSASDLDIYSFGMR